jgi:hypothetical protein
MVELSGVKNLKSDDDEAKKRLNANNFSNLNIN